MADKAKDWIPMEYLTEAQVRGKKLRRILMGRFVGFHSAAEIEELCVEQIRQAEQAKEQAAYERAAMIADSPESGFGATRIAAAIRALAKETEG